ncbi:MAG: CusA/CzcA family heavy metal efflux RND transporter [Myxococcales bacterium]|nr:CusA/CzcA family heavy metal efflux RND transporter [Myxococcales bacterium]
MQRILRFAISRPFAVLAIVAVFCIVAATQVLDVPVEAFPDVTNTQVQVITLAPGRAAEEVERQVTIPIERELAGLPDCTEQRSVSVYGLSQVTLTFEDGADEFAARVRVGERLRQVDLAPGIVARIGPESSPVGEIYRYTIEGEGLDAVARRGLQDWVIGPALRRVTGVADVVSMGGFQRQISVEPDPMRLSARQLSVTDVVASLQRSSGAVGGHYLRHGAEEYVVRGMGYLRDGRDVGRSAITARDGVPILVRDVGRVLAGSVPRRGVIGRGSEDETPQGIVLLRRRAHPARVLQGIHRAVDEANEQLARRGARIVPYYDRSELIDRALHTVKHNMIEGALLVVIVLAVFLRSFRGPMIVAVVMPLALLTAFLGLRLRGLPANLISLGAIDFGILVDGAVIFVETAYHLRAETPDQSAASIAEKAGRQVVRPIVFSLAIIATALLPVFTMQRVEGRIFAPMAMTYAFAIIGALVWTLTAVPALAALLLGPTSRAQTHDASNDTAAATHSDEPAFVTWLRARYERVAWASTRRSWIAALALALICMVSVAGAKKLGSEFLPELNEGGMFVTAIFPASQSLEEGARLMPRIRAMIREFPEVHEAVSQLGRPEDGTDPAPVNVGQVLVSLHPEEQWTTGRSRQQLLDEIRAKLATVPRVEFVFSQPIVDNVLESISGIKGKVVLKLFGDDDADLNELVRVASAAEAAISNVRGVKDLGLYQTGTVPQLLIEIDRDAVARYGLDVGAVEDVIEAALGGVAATQIWEGERKIDVVVRFPEASRSSVDRIREIPIRTPAGTNIVLGAVANARVAWGRAAIQRAQGRRFVALKFNVEGRDLGSVVAEARDRVARAVALPPNVTATWGGEFENQQRAMGRLAVIVPAALVLIGLLLFWALARARAALVVMLSVPACAPGALAALYLTNTSLSVSAAVGFIALLGQTVLAGLVMVSSIDELRAEDPTLPMSEAIVAGVSRRLRAVLVTALLASLGLLPAATSRAIGSETQRPFALVVVGGVFVATPLILALLPALYALVERAPSRPSPAQQPPAAFLAILAVSVAAAIALAPSPAQAFTFEQALAAMRSGHTGLRAAAVETRAAREDITAAGRWTNPQIQAQYARSVGWTSYDPALGAGTVVISQWIETAGVPAARARVAEALVTAADEDARALERALSRDLRTTYIELLAAQARRDALAGAEPLYQRVERLVTARVSAGTAAPFDIERLRLTLAEYQTQRQLAVADCVRLRTLLQVIIAADNRALTGDAEGSIEMPFVLPALATTLSEAASAPEVLAARARFAATDAQVQVAQRSVFGGIGVQAGVIFGQGYDEVQRSRQLDLTVAVTVPIPVLDRGQGAVRASQLRADAAADRARWIERTYVERARLLWTDAMMRRQRSEAFVVAMGQVDESLLRASDASYAAGRSSAFDLLDAYQRFVSSKLRRIELAADARRGEVELLALIGR